MSSLRASTVNMANRKQKAYEYALDAHKHQVDKGGDQYLFHVKRVANKATENIPFGTTLHDHLWCVALLHDVLEDSNVLDLGDLYMIFGTTIGDAVVAITHLRGERYWDYMDRVTENDLAAAVKVADLRDNLDINRAIKVLRYGTTDDYNRLVITLIPRYIKALEFLNV